MLEMNKDLHFYAADYSLALFLRNSGGVSGLFHPLTDEYGSRKDYPCKGCYYVPEPDVVNLAFTIEWSPSTENESDFTCFSGQIINQNILVLDWMLINQKKESNYAVSGSTFLYSSLYLDRKEKAPQSVRPFPIDIKLVKT
jgi:hypothetical protein